MKRRGLLGTLSATVYAGAAGCLSAPTAEGGDRRIDPDRLPRYETDDPGLRFVAFDVNSVTETRETLEEAGVDLGLLSSLFDGEDRFAGEHISRSETDELLFVGTERPEGRMIRATLAAGEFDPASAASATQNEIEAESVDDAPGDSFAVSASGDAVGHRDRAVAFGRDESAVRALLSAPETRSAPSGPAQYVGPTPVDPGFLDGLWNYGTANVHMYDDIVRVNGYDAVAEGTVAQTFRYRFPSQGAYELEAEDTVAAAREELTDTEVHTSEEGRWVRIDGTRNR